MASVGPRSLRCRRPVGERENPAVAGLSSMPEVDSNPRHADYHSAATRRAPATTVAHRQSPTRHERQPPPYLRWAVGSRLARVVLAAYSRRASEQSDQTYRGIYGVGPSLAQVSGDS
jgi:hypothetical protein